MRRCALLIYTFTIGIAVLTVALAGSIINLSSSSADFMLQTTHSTSVAPAVDVRSMPSPDPAITHTIVHAHALQKTATSTWEDFSNANSQVLAHSTFAGSQSMEQRAASLQALTQPCPVHCGFHAKSGWDAVVAQTSKLDCDIAVLTVVFNGVDRLYNPCPPHDLQGTTNILNATDHDTARTSTPLQTCYVAIVDEVTAAFWKRRPDFGPMRRGLQLQSTRTPGPGLAQEWQIIVYNDTTEPLEELRAVPRRNSRIPKLLQHRFFPQAQFLVYMDGKVAMNYDGYATLVKLNFFSNTTAARDQVDWVGLKHPKRNDIYQEAKEIIDLKYSNATVVEQQVAQYRSEGLPLMSGLIEGMFFVRRNVPWTRLLGCLWHNEYVRYSDRDQLSFNYVLFKLGQKAHYRTAHIWQVTWPLFHERMRVVGKSKLSQLVSLNPKPRKIIPCS